MIRYLHTIGEAYATRDQGECSAFGFWLGRTHPVYDAMRSQLPDTRRLYAWYLRVPDLPGFLRHVASALERRLATSVVAGYTGEVKTQASIGAACGWCSTMAACRWRRCGCERRTSVARQHSLI